MICCMEASPCFGQGFLNKISKGIENVGKELEKIGKTKPKEATNPQPAANNDVSIDTTYAKVESIATLASFVNDLQRANLKGNIKSVVENKTDTYIYDENGMLIRFSCEDPDPGAYSYAGTIMMEYKIQNDVPLLVKREVLLKDYLSFGGESLSKPENRSYTYNPETNLLIEEYESNSKTRLTYQYDKAGRKVRMETIRVGSDSSPMLYLYDTNGRLKEVHMGEVSEYPHETFEYDTKGRIIKHKVSSSETYLYTYNEHNDVVTKEITGTFGEDEDSTQTFKYTYDAQGNWVKCITYFSEDDTKLTTRVIQYAQ